MKLGLRLSAAMATLALAWGCAMETRQEVAAPVAQRPDAELPEAPLPAPNEGQAASAANDVLAAEATAPPPATPMFGPLPPYVVANPSAAATPSTGAVTTEAGRRPGN